MTTELQVKNRLKVATDEDQRDVNYYLRLVVANVLEGDGGDSKPRRQEGRLKDQSVRYWEEGRYSAVQTNLMVTAEKQTFNRPDFTWTDIPNPRGGQLATVRKAYYMWLWDQSNMARAYWLKFLDLLTLGEANIGCFVRGDGIEVEWCDALNVFWDPSHKDPDQRRYVAYEKSLPLGIALKYYPELSRKKPLQADGKNAEEEILVTCYWDRDEGTEAVLYKNEFIHGPTQSRYPQGALPIRASTLAELPSLKHMLGIVPRGLGSHELDLMLMRAFRDIALASEPVAVATGWPNESGLKALEGDPPNEGFRILRTNSPQGKLTWLAGPEIQASSLGLKSKVEQNMNAEFGVNEFERSQTDTNIDFASQLGFLAQQSGGRSRFLALRVEEGMRDDMLRLIMPIAQAFEARDISLSLNGVPIDFGVMDPINPLLGSDGFVVFKPGGMMYQSKAQKLQEEMIFANILQLAATMPPGLDEPFLQRVLVAAEVDAPEEWMLRYQQAKAEMMAQQQMMAMAQMEAQARGENVQAQQGGPQKQPAAA